MQAINDQLQDTLQTLHRKAIDADAFLDQLQQSQKGKFQAIFTEESGFETSSKRFSPYVEAIKDSDEATFKAGLAPLVKKIELALTTLAQFQAVGKQ